MDKALNIIEAGAALTADKLGDARARAKVIKDEIKALEEALIAHGASRIEGYHYAVTVTHAERKTTAWKKIAIDLGASAVRIAKNSRKYMVTTVGCRAHKKS